MKLSEIKPCANCKQPVGVMFYIIRCSLAFLNYNARTNLGLMMVLGNSLELAETMSPNSEAVTIAGEENQVLWSELILCQDCFMNKINLAELIQNQMESEP